jgi:hypothetical protein
MKLKVLVIAAMFGVLIGCSGKAGGDGAAGASGPTGPAGQAGTTNKITKAMGCTGTISGLVGAAGAALNGLVINYTASVLSSGDVFIQANIASSSIAIGSSVFYSASSAGAATGPVVFVDDFATPNGGYWTITGDRTLLNHTAVYTDNTLGAQSPVTITSSNGNCTMNNY